MAEKSGFSKKQVKEFITDLIDLAYREAKKGEFALPGLGKLVKQKRKRVSAGTRRQAQKSRFLQRQF